MDVVFLASYFVGRSRIIGVEVNFNVVALFEWKKLCK